MSLEQALASIVKELDQSRKDIDTIKRTMQHFYVHGGPPRELTIASGAVTATLPNLLLTPETGTSDDLDTINGGVDGKILIIANARDGDTITLTPYTISGGNIDLRGSGNGRIIGDRHDSVFVIYREATGHWEQIGPDTLNSLIGVVIDGSPSDGDVLTFDVAGGSVWTNKPAATGGVDNFLDLTDTPNSYTGEGGKVVAVKMTEDGLEFVSPASGTVAKYSALVGDTSNTTYTVNHALGSTDVIVSVYEDSTGDIVYPDMTIVDANNVDVIFTIAPSTDEFRVVIIG